MDSLNIQARAAAVLRYCRRHRFQLAIIGAALVLGALWGVIVVLRPMPPLTVVMATGPEGSAYHELGKEYREILAREGVKLRLVTTAGGSENLARMKDLQPRVDVAFLPGGITNRRESPGLESLGTIFYEPMWFFYRDIYRGKSAEALKGRKISIGPVGSGTRELAQKILGKNGIDERWADLLPLTPQEAGERLVRGEIDAAFMMTGWDAPTVQRLLTAEGIELVSYPRVDAYIAIFPYLDKVVLPEGVVDLARNRPSGNVSLFATKASLVVREDLHPALQYLLLDAAGEIHSGPGIFQKAGQFPAAESIDLPLSDEARHFYKSGKPFFQRHLPFWLAVLMDRLLVLIIPIAGLIYPLVQMVLKAYDSSMRQRIYRLYGELRFLEKDLRSRGAGQGNPDLKVRLDRIEEKANRIQVPATYASMLYTLREHISRVREVFHRQAVMPTAAETGMAVSSPKGSGAAE